MHLSTETSVPRWSDLQAILPPDLSPEAIDLVRRATLPARHQARVAAARAAAMQALEAAGLPEHLAPALAVLELHGEGGPCAAGSHYGPARSRRAPWASGLGSGRRRAADGGPWNAAIAEVAGGTQVGPEDVLALAPLVPGQAEAFCRAQILRIGGGIGNRILFPIELVRWDRALSAVADYRRDGDLIALYGAISKAAVLYRQEEEDGRWRPCETPPEALEASAPAGVLGWSPADRTWWEDPTHLSRSRSLLTVAGLREVLV